MDLEPAHAAAQRFAERPAVGHPGRYASGIGSRPRLLENRGSGRHVPDLLRTAWFLTALPGAAIAMAVLSLNLVGDGLNEILNPRSDDR